MKNMIVREIIEELESEIFYYRDMIDDLHSILMDKYETAKQRHTPSSLIKELDGLTLQYDAVRLITEKIKDKYYWEQNEGDFG